MAAASNLKNGDLINIVHEGRTAEFPVFVMPGHAKESITVTIGYGRTRAGRVGNGLCGQSQFGRNVTGVRAGHCEGRWEDLQQGVHAQPGADCCGPVPGL